MKSYIEYMKEISADELYDSLVGYGLFADKLPPCFSSKQFLDYCKTRTQSFSKHVEYSYAVYENIRNINIPRQLGIPVPMAYEIQCKLLKDLITHNQQVNPINEINFTHKCQEN